MILAASNAAVVIGVLVGLALVVVLGIVLIWAQIATATRLGDLINLQREANELQRLTIKALRRKGSKAVTSEVEGPLVKSPHVTPAVGLIRRQAENGNLAALKPAAIEVLRRQGEDGEVPFFAP